MHWLNISKIAVAKHTKSISGDNFEDKYTGHSGRLVKNAAQIATGKWSENLYVM